MQEEVIQIEYDSKELRIATKYRRKEADWIVFLHGIGCAKESFDAVFDDELAEKYSILTFDFVGFGESDKPDDFSYSLEDHAAIAKLVIEHFAPTSLTVVAHSMGGTIGLLLVRELNNLVSFVNVEGNLISEDAGIVSRQTAEQIESDFIANGFNDFLTALKVSSDAAYRTWSSWYEISSPIAIHRSGTSLVEWSDSGKLLPYFNQLKKKAFVYGDKTDVSLLLPQFSGVDVYSVPNSAHFMMLDNPSAFYTAIRSHLASGIA
jgi:pimeloyl-ACP methyl ester carboxylesterase